MKTSRNMVKLWVMALAISIIWVMMVGTAYPWTTKMATSDPTNKPLSDGVWGNVGSFSLSAGQKIWFGVSNIHVPSNTKKATLKLQVTDGDKLQISDVKGYYNGGSSSSTTYGYSGPTAKPAPAPANTYEWKASVRPQPSWEVFELIYPGKYGDRKDFTVSDDRGTSGCDESSSGTHVFNVESGTITDEESYCVTEIHYYPISETLYVAGSLEPRITVPSETGDWEYEILSTDPYGEPRPLGGVRFYTLGPGICTDADITYSVWFGTMAMEQWYDVFHFDATNGEWISYYAYQKVPTLTEWGMIVLAIMLVISALWVYRSKRKARVTAR